MPVECADDTHFIHTVNQPRRLAKADRKQSLQKRGGNLAALEGNRHGTVEQRLLALGGVQDLTVAIEVRAQELSYTCHLATKELALDKGGDARLHTRAAEKQISCRLFGYRQTD